MEEGKVLQDKNNYCVKQYKYLFDGLAVSYDGEFMRNGKPKKVIFPFTITGRKATARIHYSKDNKRHYYQASMLVAMAYRSNWSEDKCIIYRDGDIHNIHAENLLVVDTKQFNRYKLRNSGYTAISLKERIKKLEMVIKEASLTIDFLNNRSFNNINIHTTERLIPILKDYCLKTLYLGEKTTQRIVPECIARMYEVIDNGMCLYNYERYCKKLLLNYKKKGSFGVTGNIPKSVLNNVEQINFDCLWERYKMKKQN